MKFKRILSKFSVLRNFYIAVLQPPYVGIEEEEGGSREWGVGGGQARCA